MLTPQDSNIHARAARVLGTALFERVSIYDRPSNSPERCARCSKVGRPPSSKRESLKGGPKTYLRAICRAGPCTQGTTPELAEVTGDVYRQDVGS